MIAVAGDRTRVTRVTGGNTHHYTTTTSQNLARTLLEKSYTTTTAQNLERTLLEKSYTTTTAQNREGRRCRSNPFEVRCQGRLALLVKYCKFF
jgi:hypothetical protein